MMNEKSVRVLIVDDQAPFRDVARLVVDLTDGFEVVGEARSGEESVEMARSLEPDLILMDVNMPGIDGTEATKIILGERPGVTVLLLSTYEPAEYEPRAAEAGASAYIPKSAFDPDRLQSAWTTAAAR
jgi:DNA-binding NarL/FixJ family response regulator